MAEIRISLSQEELNRVLKGVRKDNAQNAEIIIGQSSAAISQAELDLVLGGGTISTVVKSAPAPEPKNTPVELSVPISMPVSPSPAVSVEPSTPLSTAANQDTKNMTMEEKIAARKARMEALLAQVNAQSPKRVSVVYGSMLSTGDKISKYEKGTIIELDREYGSDVDVLCDGKLIAKGKILGDRKQAAVEITFMIEQNQ